MEIRVLDHSEIDMKKWESCVTNSLNTCVFAHSWYLDTLSFGWEAVVMGDYEAVMPYFVEDGKACLRFGISWTGIYSKSMVDAEVGRLFIEALDGRFRKIDLVFDKYFPVPDASTGGRFSREDICLLETINPPEEFSNGDEFLEVLKSRYPKQYDPEIRFREYTAKNVQSLRYEDFMELDRRMNVRTALKLKTLTERAVSRKFGYFMEISVSDSKLRGAILVTFCDGYIFVPFLRCRDIGKSFAQYTMLLDFVMRHFAYRPGILVMDAGRLGVRADVLSNLGAAHYNAVRYRKNFWVSMRKLLRI